MLLKIKAIVDVDKGSRELAERKLIGALEGITVSGGEGEEDYSMIILPDSVEVVEEVPEGEEVSAEAKSDVSITSGTGNAESEAGAALRAAAGKSGKDEQDSDPDSKPVTEAEEKVD